MANVAKLAALLVAVALAAPVYGQAPETRLLLAADELERIAPPLDEFEAMALGYTEPFGHDSPADYAFGCEGESIECRPYYDAIFVYGGPYTYNSMGDTARYDSEYDGNFNIAIGHQRFWPLFDQFQLGHEVGLAGRFGDETTAEIWAGPSLRYDSIVIGDCLNITPSFTAGFSVVSATMGGEFRRESTREGDATLLFYLGPEIALSRPCCPSIELLYRLHHRCGCGGFLGDIRDGYNANVIGLRLRY